MSYKKMQTRMVKLLKRYMNIRDFNSNQLTAMAIAAVGVYSLAVMLLSISDVYLNWQHFLYPAPAAYPLCMTAITAISPLSFFGIAAFVYLNKRNYFIIPLALYGYWFFVSFTLYGVFLLLIYWWFRRDEAKSL